jgi:RimJ/RimL family protein N-acetyltransferase
MHAFLETDRLLLRRFTSQDVDNLIDLNSDPEVMRFVPEAACTTRHEIETEYLPAYLNYYERYAGYGFWAAIEKSTGRFLGWFHLRPRDSSPPDEVELGFRLRQTAWGKGYGTEGSRALLRKGFTQLGMQRVVAEAMTVNTASRRVMDKVGLKFVRSFPLEWPVPVEGQEQGGVEYALSRSEWEERQGADHRHPVGM